MAQDYRELRNMDPDELVRQARSKTLPRVTGGPVNELRRHRAYYIEAANDLVRTAASDGRAMRPDEDRSVAGMIDAAQDLAPVIEELEGETRKALGGPLQAVSTALRPSGR